MIDRDGVRLRWKTLDSKLDERQLERGQRLFAANEVRAAGQTALGIVHEIIGLARPTKNRGEDDLAEGPHAQQGRRPQGSTRRRRWFA